MTIKLIEPVPSLDEFTAKSFTGSEVRARYIKSAWDGLNDWTELTVETKGGYLFAALNAEQTRQLAKALAEYADVMEACNA